MIPLRTRSSVRRTRRPAAALLLAVTLALGSCRREEPEVRWAETVFPRLSLRARVAQMVVPALDAADATGGARRWVETDSVGGVLLRPGRARATAATLAALRATAPVPLLAVAEVDGGVGALVPEGTDFPPAAVLAARGLADEAREAGAATGAEARALGVDLAIVALPEIGGAAPVALPRPAVSTGAEAVAAYLEGLRGEGVLAAVRALPVRRPPGDTIPVPTLRWDRARLAAVDLPVVRAAVAAEADAVLLPPLSLPALTGDSTPLALSPVASDGLLRRDLGFGGLLSAEVGPGSPLAAARGEAEAAVRAVAAGADLLLGVADPAAAIDALVAAVRAGRIPAGRVDEAARRVLDAKERLRDDARPATRPDSLLPLLRTADAVDVARQAAEAARVVLGAAPATVLRGCRAPLLLSRPGDAPVLRSETAPLYPAMRALFVWTGASGDTVPLALAGPIRAADCWVVVETSSGAAAALLDVARRAARADTGDTDAAGADTVPVPRPDPPTVLVRLAATPPDSLPPARSVVLAWGAGPEAQRAAAEALALESVPEESAATVRWPAAAVLRAAAAPEAGMSEAGLARADAAIRQAVEAGTFPGAALAVGRRGKLVRLRGYGRLPGGVGEVTGAGTLYDIASLSKVAGTTAAVMALVDDGKLRLDAPVRRYLPGFTGRWKEDVTIRHLLTHTAGLPAGDWLYGSARSPEAALRQAVRATLQSEPGERMVYSDYGFILLAAVVEEVAEEPMDTYLARRVYAPLGMSSTMYLPPRALRPVTAPGANRSEQGYPLRGVVHDANAYRLGGVAGHAGLFSTAADLAVYAQTLLNGGSYGTQRVYSPETVRRFTTVRTRVGNRAWGWDVPAARSSAGSYFSARSFGHTGFTGTSVWIDPAQELFVVLLTNRTYADASQAAMLEVRTKVHDAVATAITDATVLPRPGSPAAIEAERQARLERERARRQKQRPRPARRRG